MAPRTSVTTKSTNLIVTRSVVALAVRPRADPEPQQVAVINDGRIQQTDTPDALYERPPTRSSWASVHRAREFAA